MSPLCIQVQVCEDECTMNSRQKTDNTHMHTGFCLIWNTLFGLPKVQALNYLAQLAHTITMTLVLSRLFSHGLNEAKWLSRGQGVLFLSLLSQETKTKSSLVLLGKGSQRTNLASPISIEFLHSAGYILYCIRVGSFKVDILLYFFLLFWPLKKKKGISHVEIPPKRRKSI